MPSNTPSNVPTTVPSSEPTVQPSSNPSQQPTNQPTTAPSNSPAVVDTSSLATVPMELSIGLPVALIGLILCCIATSYAVVSSQKSRKRKVYEKEIMDSADDDSTIHRDIESNISSVLSMDDDDLQLTLNVSRMSSLRSPQIFWDEDSPISVIISPKPLIHTTMEKEDEDMIEAPSVKVKPPVVQGPAVIIVNDSVSHVLQPELFEQSIQYVIPEEDKHDIDDEQVETADGESSDDDRSQESYRIIRRVISYDKSIKYKPTLASKSTNDLSRTHGVHSNLVKNFLSPKSHSYDPNDVHTLGTHQMSLFHTYNNSFRTSPIMTSRVFPSSISPDNNDGGIADSVNVEDDMMSIVASSISDSSFQNTSCDNNEFDEGEEKLDRPSTKVRFHSFDAHRFKRVSRGLER